ncbi:MAG: dihydropteroate synthase [Desulfonatronovibrionaceae bacterium]
MLMGQGEWKLAGGRTVSPAPFLIVGILNVTPDSFFDGGDYAEPKQALSRARELVRDGADLVDVGGESTRPFSRPVGEEVELGRVLPVVEAIRASLPYALLSVDTYRSGVARAVLEKGAGVINDVSACAFDPGLVDVLAEYRPGYVLMHSKGRPEDMQVAPEYENVLDEIEAFFDSGLDRLTRAGLPEENIVLDPGIGFGKTLEHNLQILGGMRRFTRFNRPLYVGLSNKSLWGKLLDLPLADRNAASQAGTVLAAENGADIHRVHDVRSARHTLTIIRETRDAVSRLPDPATRGEKQNQT